MTVQPNILLITWDQMRADCLGAAGSKVKTPNLDRLTARGTMFTRCFSQSAVCMPSRISIATGRYPSEHGVFTNGPDFPEGESTFIEKLRDRGY
ncbi:MAG TPA: sulfatase, partial [Spirochaetia bacterium]|nr:sulfatase [Spirochaetia bacterium]